MTRGLVVDDELKLEKSAAQAANARGQHQLKSMHANSKSMSVLSDDYGSYQRSKDANSRQNSRDAANTNFQRSGRIQSPHNTSRGKMVQSGSRGGLNFLPDILLPNRSADGNFDGQQQVGSDKSVEALKGLHSMSQMGLGSVTDLKDAAKADELKNVRQQIVHMLSERYPGPTNEQLLAVEKSKKRALQDRELKLKVELEKKDAAEAARKAVRARAKKARVRSDSDDDLPFFGHR